MSAEPPEPRAEPSAPADPAASAESPAPADPPASAEPPALTDTPVGRRLVNVVVVLLLGAMLISNLPPSQLREQARTAERPITDITGLSQNWALFAPNPRSTFLRLRAEVERADGTVEEWTPPVGDRLVGVYRTYRWRKWANGTAAEDASRLHRGAVHYLATTFADEDRAPVTEIRLYRGTHSQPRPGSGQAADRSPSFEETLLLRAPVTPDRGAAP